MLVSLSVFRGFRQEFLQKILQKAYKHFWIFTKIQTNFTKIQTFFTNILQTKWIFTKIQKIQKQC